MSSRAGMETGAFVFAALHVRPVRRAP